MIDEEISIEGIEGLFEATETADESTIMDNLVDVGEAETSTEVDLEEDQQVAPQVPELVETQPEESKEQAVPTERGASRVQDLIELGLLEDTRISTSEDDEEGTLLSEHEGLTQEQIRTIIQLQAEKREQAISEKYIPKENLSDHHLKLIEIMRNGGDLATAFENPNQALKRPFEGKDLDNVDIQRQIAMTYYTTQKGHNPKEAQVLIAQKERDFELDTFSKDVVTAYNQAYDNYLDKVNQDAAQAKENEKKVLVDRRKKLTDTFKKGGMKDKAFNPVIEGVTKVLPDGRLPIHKVIEEILEKPEENYEVLLHLMNKQVYDEMFKMKTKSASTEEVLRLFDALPKDKANQNSNKQKTNLSEIEEELMKIKITN